MTVAPAPRLEDHGWLARLSLDLSAFSVVVIGLVALVSVWDVRDTGWGGWLVPTAVVLGLGAGIGGAGTAIAALVQGERRLLLGVPILIGALCALVLLGELFVWE
ncbi:MAG TPA: hypothetical protein VD704_03545 [Gaiellaceae bacterium]|nr:hypothetical protein [Gaiellaceae bacterium]